MAVNGEVLVSDPPNQLSYTWHVHYHPDAKQEQPSRVTFTLDSEADATRLTLVHDNFPANSVVLESINEGWPKILCNLKTLLETDEVMAVS